MNTITNGIEAHPHTEHDQSGDSAVASWLGQDWPPSGPRPLPRPITPIGSRKYTKAIPCTDTVITVRWERERTKLWLQTQGSETRVRTATSTWPMQSSLSERVSRNATTSTCCEICVAFVLLASQRRQLHSSNGDC